MTRRELLQIALILSATSKVSGTAIHAQNTSTPQFSVGDEADFFGLLDLERPELAALKTAVNAKNWEAAKLAWSDHLRRRMAPRWIWSHFDRTDIKRVLDENFGGMGGSIPKADKALNREFTFLGVAKKLETHPQWLQGANEWTNVLSRFEYFRDLGQAYWATGNPKYASDYVLLLRDWIAKNPAPPEVANSWSQFGTVWRTLETGIRGQNWFDSMQFFMDAPEFDAHTQYLLTRSLVEHARRLHAHETTFRQGNWQVVECTGLASIGIMLPEFREAASWRERSFGYMVEHMQKDVYADGGHWELAPGYHMWVMNQFLHVSLLCKRNGYQVPGLLERHEKMYEFLLRLSKPNRHLPVLNDCGDDVVSDPMGVGALLYNRSDMRFLGPKKAEAAWVWKFGPQVLEQYAKLPARRPDFTSCLLPNSKFAMMRAGWDTNDPYLLFDCAPWGGGHNHQDRLQFIVAMGRDLLVDPGIYSYDQPLSKTYFRNAIAHNVLLIDGTEQIQANPQVLAWETTPEADFASGSIEDKGLRHQRSVLFVKPGYWVVVDHVFGTGEHELTRLLHFPIGSTQVEGKGVRTAFADGSNLHVQVADTSRLEMRQGWFPTASATAKEAPVAAFVAKLPLPAVQCTLLFPFQNVRDVPRVELVAGDDALTARLRVTFPNGQTDDIAIAAEIGALKIGASQSQSRALVVRKGQISKVIATGTKPYTPAKL